MVYNPLFYVVQKVVHHQLSLLCWHRVSRHVYHELSCQTGLFATLHSLSVIVRNSAFLSVSRILLVLPVILLFENGFYLASLISLIVASLTDYFDGFFARKKNQTSNVGALLDLLADKLFVSILLIWITFNFDSLLILVSSILIISREISISYLRLFIITIFYHKKSKM